jgi:hypothetical protein
MGRNFAERRLTGGPFSGIEAEDWVRGRKARPADWTFAIDSLRARRWTPLRGGNRREKRSRKKLAAAVIEVPHD